MPAAAPFYCLLAGGHRPGTKTGCIAFVQILLCQTSNAPWISLVHQSGCTKHWRTKIVPFFVTDCRG
ncbi:unnamed protein product [Urochloa humidicola]